MTRYDQWIDQRKVPLVMALVALIFAGWLWAYLTIPYPAVFGDEFSTYAITRAKADPAYNLSDYDWVFKLRGSMLAYTAVYQTVHAREGSPLVMAQFLNALCLFATLPLVWLVARSLLPATVSLCLVIIYGLMPSHGLGAYFILEPMFYLGFWAVLATTLLALRGRWQWSVAAGLMSALLANIKPHGLVTCGWSLALTGIAGIFFVSDIDNRRRPWLGAWWLGAFGFLQLISRWASAGASTDTVNGKGFYGEVFKKLIQPAQLWTSARSGLEILKLHFGLYGIIYGLIAGLAMAVMIDLLRLRSRTRAFSIEDLFALSIPWLGCGLLGMTIAFSGLINETTRVHGRYWSYIVIPSLISGIYLITKPLVTRSLFYRSLPLVVMLAVCWFGLLRISPGLQIAANDCPEIHWAYLGIWHPEWQRVLVLVFATCGVLAGLWFMVYPRSGLSAVLALLLAANLAADYFVVGSIRQSSLANGVQSRMSDVLQSYKDKLVSQSVLLVAPRAFMTGGAMFGLSRIPMILERPPGSTLVAGDLSSNPEIIGTIGQFQLPADFGRAWSEGDYAVYVRNHTPPAKQP